ncbi:hypothetical protein DL769_002326 [Monosporascus sp. CRB-8-3]|nr:hypothetical protein DL769_002326 [Monosporascus sp. CRB-8-3]
MASHGVARTVRTRTEEQRLQDLAKIEAYRDVENQVRAKIAANAYDDPALFQLTTKLLRLNPEYYTIWNVRRRCLISGLLCRLSDGSWPSRASPSTSPSATTRPSSEPSSPSSSAVTPPGPSSPTTGQSGTTVDEETTPTMTRERQQESDGNIIQSELAFTIPLLLESPKCYWIWNFRRWVLSQATLRLAPPAARKVWETELGLASKMLTKDCRNFHAWGYRRYVVANLESSALQGKSMAEDELAYSRRKIDGDLSNFSAWHNRSRLILRVLDERGADNKARAQFLDKELALVKEGLNVGPDDQSLWYYHQFLMSQIVNCGDRNTIVPALALDERITYLRREIDDIKDLLEDYVNIKWIYEALLDYGLALARLEERAGRNGEREDLQLWLEKLRALDPMRKARWSDVQKQLVSLSA